MVNSKSLNNLRPFWRRQSDRWRNNRAEPLYFTPDSERFLCRNCLNLTLTAIKTRLIPLSIVQDLTVTLHQVQIGWRVRIDLSAYFIMIAMIGELAAAN